MKDKKITLNDVKRVKKQISSPNHRINFSSFKFYYTTRRRNAYKEVGTTCVAEQPVQVSASSNYIQKWLLSDWKSSLRLPQWEGRGRREDGSPLNAKGSIESKTLPYNVCLTLIWYFTVGLCRYAKPTTKKALQAQMGVIIQKFASQRRKWWSPELREA